MKKSLFHIKITVLSFLAIASVAGFVTSTQAAHAAPMNGPGGRPGAQQGQALTISPPLLDVSADPGKTTTAKIKLTNISNGELTIKNQLNDFGAKNETGEPNILFDSNNESTYSLKQWIQAQPAFKLAPKQTKTLEFPIRVPANAEPGGHYAIIRFTGSPSESEENGVGTNASIGTLVLMKVSGDIKEKATFTEAFAANEQYAKADFFEGGPIKLVERIKNEGNIHIKPTGTIKVTDSFGNEVETQRVNGNPEENRNSPRSVLPDSIRRFDQEFGRDKFLFGKYTANVSLSYGQNNDQKLTKTYDFWVIPVKLIVAVVLGAIILIALLVIVMKRYNAFIVGQSKKKRKK